MRYQREIESRRWTIVLLLWAILVTGIGLYGFMAFLLYSS